MKIVLVISSLISLVLLTSCGGGGSSSSSAAGCSGSAVSAADCSCSCSSERGQLVSYPVTSKSFTADQMLQFINSNGLPEISDIPKNSGAPVCNVTVQKMTFKTVGANNESITDSGALMVPSGTGANCTAPFPIVMYAHGTAAFSNYDLSTMSDVDKNPASTEAWTIAAAFAARGFIVVAPNYAGYDISNLPYHPYLNATQQSNEMMDMLTAAKTALAKSNISFTQKLFLTGWSEGGHVAMATHKAMQNASTPITVTASVPISGPYAVAAFGDATFYGAATYGSTLYLPFVINSYQSAYGNLYNQFSDLYAAPTATAIKTNYLPTLGDISKLFLGNGGALPANSLSNALFSGSAQSTPAGVTSGAPTAGPQAQSGLYAAGFDNQKYLISDAYRLSYLTDARANPDGVIASVTNGFSVTSSGLPATSPANGLRKALKANDLRNWTPNAQTKVLMCSGSGDPNVPFSINTGTMKAYWSSGAGAAPAGVVSAIDLDQAQPEPYKTTQANFQKAIANFNQTGLDENYHTYDFTFCSSAASILFQSLR